MDNIISEDIKVSGIEEKNGRIVLLEDQGKKYPVKYSFFKTKRDGGETVAHQNFQSLGVGIGNTYLVTYKEEESEYKGKPYTLRKVMKIEAPDGLPRTNTPYIAKSSPVGPSRQEFDDLVRRVATLENQTPDIIDDIPFG